MDISLAKEKLFGKKKKPQWPTLERFVEEGILLQVDLAYARLQTDDEAQAATHAALIAMMRRGHLCLKKETVAELSPQLAELVEEGAQLPKYAQIEASIVRNVHRHLERPLEENIPEIEGEVTDEQREAVILAAKYPLSLITRGPGTGKTYTATQIAKRCPGKLLLAAPTGKAATHLSAKVGMGKSGTLHALLRGDPLEADLVIVDECSMIDPKLFAKLLESIEGNTRLVLMGDVDQLPAVEGGSLFADLIESKKIPTTELTKCMRSDRREILDLASQIREGKGGDLCTIDLGFASGDIETIYARLWEHTKDLFPRDWKEGMDTFRILSTLRKGPLGVDALNAYFFEKFAPQTDWHPILITRNDPRTGLSNGDTGVLEKGKGAYFGEEYFPIQALPPYEYAYCISVHKSQGSEYDHVLFLAPEGSESFGREVLYTAVTRAKSKLEIDGAPEQISSALARSSRKDSHLSDKFS